MDVAQEGLLAGVDHLHGPPGSQRQEADLHLHAHVLAGPEGAADAGEVQADLLERKRQGGGDLLLVDVQPLGGDVEVDTAVIGRDREPGLGAHEGLVLHAGLVAALDDDCADGVGVAAADLLAEEHVSERMDGLGVDRRRRRRRAALAAHSRRRSRRRRVCAVSGWSAATAATGSPMYLTTSHAKTG